MFFNHVIGYYRPIVAISSSMYDPGNRELHWGSASDRNVVSITERELKENIYDKITKDTAAPKPKYGPDQLDLGDILIFSKDKLTVVGYLKIDSMESVRLPKE